jgi:hypothetical protein
MESSNVESDMAKLFYFKGLVNYIPIGSVLWSLQIFVNVDKFLNRHF